MQRLRTISGFVRVLVALFLAAQFAGVVSSPLQSAQAFAAAADMHMQMHHHMRGMMSAMGDAEMSGHHGDRNGGHNDSHVDHCCALHAFFAGILPPAVAIETVAIAHQRVAASRADIGRGVAPDRPDRPPRPDALI